MHQELIRELAMITDEERRILEGKQEIDPQLYTEKKEMVVDSAKLLKKGKLIQVRPHTRFVHFPVQNLIENMVWTIFYDISNKRSSNQITMGLLFLQLLNYMDKMEAGGRKFDTEIMANVYRYIEDHFKEGTLSELAVEMKVDVYWLSREIKKKSGKTYKELLQEKRMQQAVYLLINSRIAVSDIIEAVGYDNTSYFYRKFKERYGISPKEYRIENMN